MDGSPEPPETLMDRAMRAIEVNRPYLHNFSKIASIRLRDAKLAASDAITARTSRRGTLTLRCNAVAPASRKSVSVRAPISAGKTVAARTRRFRIAREYC